MSKTSFSKGELSKLHRILVFEKLIPCDKIVVYSDNFNSGFGTVYSVIQFVKGKKQLCAGFVTKTQPKNYKLQEQLYQYFGGE